MGWSLRLSTFIFFSLTFVILITNPKKFLKNIALKKIQAILLILLLRARNSLFSGQIGLQGIPFPSLKPCPIWLCCPCPVTTYISFCYLTCLQHTITLTSSVFSFSWSSSSNTWPLRLAAWGHILHKVWNAILFLVDWGVAPIW